MRGRAFTLSRVVDVLRVLEHFYRIDWSKFVFEHIEARARTVESLFDML